MRAFILCLLASCASSSSAIPDTRFVNAPAVEAVNDRKDVPKLPRERVLVRELYQFDGSFFRRMTRGMELRAHQRALGVNAFDEVPDSTWFTNRIGRHEVTPAELLDVPGAVGSPEAHKPWTIVSSKVGGMSVGFIIRDARGEAFILKFDERGQAETETTAQIVVGRLLWACGYNVTDDYIVQLRASDLVLAPDAKLKTPYGDGDAMDRADVERLLAHVEVGADGSIRGLASHLLEGKILGGHPGEGVRRDDRNDRIPHERRRDLRGAYTIFAWLDHSDVHEGNTLDLWVADRDDPQRHYVKHYFVDYGKALGLLTALNHDLRRGHEWAVDVNSVFTQLFTVGLHERRWEHRTEPGLRGLGSYGITAYHPGKWKTYTSAYVPVLHADDVDKFWGAKILIRFTPEQIRAAVDAARLSDPRSAEYLTKALISRQRMTARYWFRQVSPLDQFRVEQGGLCFDDLALVHWLEPAPDTRYQVTGFDASSRVLWSAKPIAGQTSGATCVPFSLSGARDGYTIVRITTTRPGLNGDTYVYVARTPGSGAPRVIGVWRE